MQYMCMFFRQDFSGLFYFLPFIEFVCSFTFKQLPDIFLPPFLVNSSNTYLSPNRFAKYIFSALISSQKYHQIIFNSFKFQYSTPDIIIMFSTWSILSSNCVFVLLVIVIFVLLSGPSSRLVLMISAQEQQQPSTRSSPCSTSSAGACCCPKLRLIPELHSIRHELVGSEQPDNFSASYFTGQQQSVLPSSGLVTVTSVPNFDDDPVLSLLSPSSTRTNNCSWTTTSSSSSSSSSTLQSTTTTRRCSLSLCTQHWLDDPIQWGFTSLTGQVPDLLTTGRQAISPSVLAKLQESEADFNRRMSQSVPVVVSAVYVASSLLPSDYYSTVVAASSFCRTGLTGAPCYFHNTFWFLPNTAKAWVSDIAIPIGFKAENVVAKIFPACDFIMNSRLTNETFMMLDRSLVLTANSNSTTTNQYTQSASLLISHILGGYKSEYYDKVHPDANKGGLAEYDNAEFGYHPSVALSQPGRILCHNRITDEVVTGSSSSSSSSGTTSSSTDRKRTNPRIRSNVIPVVPIDQSKSDTVFTHNLAIEACVSNGVEQQIPFSSSSSSSQQNQQQCSVTFVEPMQCGTYILEVPKDYSLLLNGMTWLGFVVAIVSSLALLLGASAIMIAIDAQLLAVISQGSCSSVTAKPSTKFLQQFLFLGRAVEEDENSAEYHSSVVAWLIGVVAITIALHGLLVVLVAFVRRKFLQRRKAGLLNGNNKNQKFVSTIDKIFGKLYQLAASSAREKQRKADKLQSSKFLLEERRVLARTAAALRFPSASLLVLLVSIQGLWYSSVNVWWYSVSPIQSMPGIVGCLFALLLTLIILVLAKQTRLIFTPYTWLHPERIEMDRRQQAIQVSVAVHLKSLISFKRSWFFPYGAWGPARPRQRMGTLFLPVQERAWIGVPFLVSLVTCIAVCVYPLTVIGCCTQQMFLSLFFFGVALVVWKSQPMRAPYANTMFVVVRGALSVLTFCRTIFLVTDDQYFDAAYFLLTVLVQLLIVVVGVVDIWCGLAEYFIWLPHLEYRQEVIRARTGGALRMQRQHEEAAAKNNNNNNDSSTKAGAASSSSSRRQSAIEELSPEEQQKADLQAILEYYDLDKDDDDDDDTDDDLMFYPGQHHAVKNQKRRVSAALDAAVMNTFNNSQEEVISKNKDENSDDRTTKVERNFLNDDDDDDDDDYELLAVEMDKI